LKTTDFMKKIKEMKNFSINPTAACIFLDEHIPTPKKVLITT